MSALWRFAEKQVRDSFSSRKFLAVFVLFLLFSTASVYMGVQNYQEQMEQFRQGAAYLPEEPTLMDVFTPMMSFNMPLAAGALALLFSYNVISREREEGTIELVLSYPVYRDEIINGKFIGGLTVLSTALFISMGMSSGLAVFMLDLIPTIEQVSRISFMMLGTVVYMAFFLALGSLFSTVFRSSWRSLFAGGIALLIFMATPLGASIAADHIYPYERESPGVEPMPGPRGDEVEVQERSVGGGVEIGGGSDDSTEEQRRQEIRDRRERFREAVSRLSPVTSYGNFVDTMLGINYESETGIQPTLRQSLESSWGYMVYLLSQTLLAFTFSYAAFMRQDL